MESDEDVFTKLENTTRRYDGVGLGADHPTGSYADAAVRHQTVTLGTLVAWIDYLTSPIKRLAAMRDAAREHDAA